MARDEPLTHGRVLRIAVPIVLANATVPLIGAVDTGVVGQLGAAAPIGAVGLGAVILTSFYWVFGFLRMGTVGMVSQALGAGDREEATALLMRALVIGLMGGLLVIMLQPLLFGLAFAVAPASREVEALARGYLGIRVWSAPAPIALYGITGWLIARERTRAVLVLQVWMNGVNVGLDFAFVSGLGWGVEGVAWATFIAEWSGLALGLFLCRRAFTGAGWRNPARLFDTIALRRMLAVNGDILLRSLLLQAIVVSFLFFGAGMDDVTLAANQVLLQFLHVSAHVLDGYAFAAETLVGKAMGARVLARLRRAVWMTSLWAGAMGIALALGIALSGGYFIDLMSTAEPVREAARAYLPWLVLGAVLGVAPFQLDGIFIGATRTRDMRNMMLLSALGYGVALAVLLPAYGNHGLWAALSISYVLRGASLMWRYPALERAV
jgi:MATE family multidrug resistance protein